MPVNNVLNVPTYKFVISKYLLFWRARPCQPLVVDKEYFGSPPPSSAQLGQWPPDNEEEAASSKVDTGRRTVDGLNFSPPPNICRPADASKCGQKTINCNSWEQIHYSRAWRGQQHKKGQIWCQLKELLDLKSYLIAQNIKVVVCDRDIFVELVSDWGAGQELT